MRISSSIAIALSCALLPLPLTAQSRITTPLQEFGHNIGDDYFLANYAQLARYWTKLDRESNRMKVVRIGTSVEGRPMLMAIITSPQNHANLGRYQEIAARLARAEGLTEAQARALAREGKAVVWIDGGLHATEVLGAQQLVQFVYEMVSRNDAETQRFLRDVILLAVPANPDGMDLVSNWYMREPVPTKRSTSGLPVLYHKYIGHDNNRDSYMASQPETQAMDSIMFRAWYPQIMYNHHQTGPAGTVMFAPPFRDPFNYNFDPLIPVGIDLVGAAIHGRFIAEGKPGSTMRTGASYSTWWNGGLRTTAYFHNIIGLLTETIGNPTPMTVAFRPERLLPSGNLPYPILPQTWRFAQSMAYELSANRAVMDVASKHREDLLYNIYKMGRNSIERGSRDNWTLTPDRVEAVKLAVARDSAAKVSATPAQYITSVLYPRAARDPRGYIIPSNQADFPTAVKFVNALVKNGITIHRATRPFTAGGRSYPAGSYVVKTAQAFRPHILDMFEPQDHPDDILYPGAPPTPPYDNAGWTLAYQMGVRFDRILDAFDGPFERLAGFASIPAPAVAAGPPWYAISRRSNDAFTAVNRLLAQGEEVYSTPAALKISSRVLDAGTFLVRAKASTAPIAREIASSTGIAFEPALGVASESGLTRLRLPRIAIYDRYGGSMQSGWLRFLLEKFAFPYEVVFPPTIDAGNLNAKYDVLILMDSASVPGASHTRNEEREPSSAPALWRARQGSMTIAKSLPQIQSFVSSGGTLLAIGEAADVGYLLQLPVASAVADNDGKPLPRSQYYVPGSILRVAVDTTSAISWGMRPGADVMFDNNPVFRLLPEARGRGIRRVAWFDTAAPLRSGWAWGQKALEGASAVIVAPIGKGHAILYGPEIYFRSQSHGTFPFLFNGIYYSQSAPR